VRDVDVTTVGAATYLHPGNVSDAHVREPFLRAAALPATLRMHGSGSMDLVGVVTGRLGAWFQHSTPAWDWLPGAALVRGAGGAAEQVDVAGLRWSLAGGPQAVAALREALEDDA
jgi:fructose-1,6-bisphosphatase/inositol monophosphatase family enzyme